MGWPVRTPRRCVQRTRDDSHSLVWADRPWSADPTTQASIALTADGDHRPYQSLSFVLFIKAASEMPPLPKLLTSNPHPCVSGLLSFKPQHRYGRPSLVVLGLFQTEKNVKQTLNSPRKRKSIPAGQAARLRGCASTQALQPGGVTAKVMGGCQGTNGRGQVLGGQYLILFAHQGGLGDAAPT